MAAIAKRTNDIGKPTWQAKVRKSGFPTQSRNFPTRRAAEEWARSIEDAMTKGPFHSTKLAASTTMKQLLG